MRKAIYTAIFGDYDTHLRPLYINSDYDYHLFTDNRNIKSNIYTIHILNGDARKAREIKILPHKYLPAYDYSIWHDGNITQRRDINQLADLQQTDFMTMKHPRRSCIYTEASKCIAMRKDYPDVIKKQMKYYKQNGFKKNMGLVATGLLFRKHTKQMQLMCENWHEQLKLYSLRDQLSFNYILKQPIDLLPYSILKTHFIYSGHHK